MCARRGGGDGARGVAAASTVRRGWLLCCGCACLPGLLTARRRVVMLWSLLGSCRQWYMNGNVISGSIPATFGQLNFLAIARFANNVITGTFPVEISNCSRLEYFSLSRNQVLGGAVV